MNRKVTDIAQIFMKEAKNTKKVIDMTAGMGKDSLFILENLGVDKLIAFDIQEKSRKACEELLGSDMRFEFILDSHENIDKHIDGKIGLVVYNLGYLPGADKNITTNYRSTLISLEKVLEILDDDGMIVMTIYPGHPAGKVEAEKIGEYLGKIDKKKYSILKIAYQNRPNNPPFVIVIEKM